MPFALSQSTYPSLLIVLILPSQQILSFPQTDFKLLKLTFRNKRGTIYNIF